MTSTIQPSEYAPYYQPYVERTPNDFVPALAEQGERLTAAWRALPAAAAGYRYAEGKWTIEEVVGHIVDIERAFSYRAMCFARGIEEEQPGVDQDIMVPRSKAVARGLESLVVEFDYLRRSNVAMFGAMDEADLTTIGRASGAESSVRALAAMIYGHAEHHAEVLTERYQIAE